MRNIIIQGGRVVDDPEKLLYSLTKAKEIERARKGDCTLLIATFLAVAAVCILIWFAFK